MCYQCQVSNLDSRTIFWYIIRFSRHDPILNGDIVLCDLSQYLVGMRQEIQMDYSLAPGWTEDTVDFRVIQRLDGQPIMADAVTPKNGGDTLSWAVQLEAR